MQKILTAYTLLILGIIGSISCSAPRLYSNQQKVRTGKLTEMQLSELRSYLRPFTKGNLQDTLIIKYEIDGESCWNNLDGQPDDYINRVLVNGQKYKATLSSERPGVSFYHFKEKGNKTNKLISWNKEIIVDEQNKLGPLLFTEKAKAACGSSGVVLPGGEYVIMRSDSHLIGFGLTKEMIREALLTNRIKNPIDRSGR